ncbi:MAG: hypothetical protein ACYC6N_27610 [Pirellulaceae bacterium]
MVKLPGEMTGECHRAFPIRAGAARVMSVMMCWGLVSVSLGQGPVAAADLEVLELRDRLDSFAPPMRTPNRTMAADRPGAHSAEGIKTVMQRPPHLDQNDHATPGVVKRNLWPSSPPPLPGGDFPFSTSAYRGPPSGGSPRGGGLNFKRQFMNRDVNGDGQVTRDELPGSVRSLFPAMDVNNSGGIDAQEADTMAARLSHRSDNYRLLTVLGSDPSPSIDSVEQVRLAIKLVDETAERGEHEISAQRRSEWLLYIMSVGSMLMGVISFGHLLTSPPPGRAPWREVDASPDAIRGVIHSTAYISVLSMLDLFWTNMRASDLHFRELNPLGSHLLADGVSPTVFKLTAVAVSVVLLLGMRRFRGAQTASWWLCLICTLVTFRWLMLDSAFLN